MNESKLLSVITPAFNEEQNLPLLHQRLGAALGSLGMKWEWIVVDDHSSDGTFRALGEIARKDGAVKALRLSSNSGSHAAILCGLHRARGDAAIVLAADLQDPPELVGDLLAKWKQGAQVVWAARDQRQGEAASKVGFARLYYFLMRNVVGIRKMPPSGADFFLLDRKVLDSLRHFNEGNASLLALIAWMGFRQETIGYNKSARVHGRSGWSFRKKLKLVVDSVVSFAYFPIRFMSLVGALVASAGLLYAVGIVGGVFSGPRPPGWASLMVVILVIGGVQMFMMGMLGEYLWRTLEASKRRPQYLVEDAINE